MRFALTRAALTRPAVSLASRTPAAFLPFIRFSSTSTETRSALPTSKPRQYTIGLTKSMYYPVYPDKKAAGTYKRTIIKNIQGDHKAFINDLVGELKLPRDQITINPVTMQIGVKGDQRDLIRGWLSDNFGPPSGTGPTPGEVKAAQQAAEKARAEAEQASKA